MEIEEAPEYISSGKAGRILGYKDTRSVVRLVELGEIAGFRMPGGHWRVELESVLDARDRFRQAS